ncbi:hypothetical protein AB0907_38575 [Streptomyces sp. NPDC006975]|uniref:hypothetical protein n=1 Tax=Streptomyces sp. NPDC006975 TaxID=3154310 RepID=UPI003455DED8
MDRDEVEDALRAVAALGVATSAAPGLGGTVAYVVPDAFPRSPSSVSSTYYDTSGALAGVAVDARKGPQVTLEGMRFVGRVPSELEEQFVRYLEERDRMVTYNQFSDFSCEALGVVVRAQRVDDVVLSRPVLVSREWPTGVPTPAKGQCPRRNGGAADPLNDEGPAGKRPGAIVNSCGSVRFS